MNIFRKLLLAAALVLPSASKSEPRLGYYMIGPMLHWNFSGSAFQSLSLGVEASLWTYSKNPNEDAWFSNTPDFSKPGYGLSFGLEGAKDAFRFYAEPQIGWVWAGLSLGPVWEVPHDKAPGRLGFQGSGWANFLAGADLRYRRVGGKNSQALGLYAKLGGEGGR